MKRTAFLLFASPALLGAKMPSAPTLGTLEARCRAGEAGPAVVIDIVGMKDARGLVRAEIYPANDKDLLRDDNRLVSEGKVFRRVDAPANETQLCVRVPGPGRYALVVLHDRNGDRKFNFTVDGVGFGGNPKLGWGKPRAARASIQAGPGLTRATVVMNYLSGFSMRPLER